MNKKYRQEKNNSYIPEKYEHYFIQIVRHNQMAYMMMFFIGDVIINIIIRQILFLKMKVLTKFITALRFVNLPSRKFLNTSHALHIFDYKYQC